MLNTINQEQTNNQFSFNLTENDHIVGTVKFHIGVCKHRGTANQVVIDSAKFSGLTHRNDTLALMDVIEQNAWVIATKHLGAPANRHTIWEGTANEEFIKQHVNYVNCKQVYQ